MRWLPVWLLLFASSAYAAAEIGLTTLADAGALVLRGATWYQLKPGVTIEDGDIVATDGREQLQIELAGGSILSLAGNGQLHLTTQRGGARVLTLASGWLKAVVKPPGLRVRLPEFEVTITDAIVVLRAEAEGSEAFVEIGSARLTDAAGVARQAKRGEHWTRVGTVFASQPLAPKAFVNALPRTFIDALPVLAPGIKSRPTPVADHDVTFAEAEVWLTGKERSAFERRFASRLREPEFRKAVEPNVARYPIWDRILHPEKYAPKPPPESRGTAPKTPQATPAK